MKKIITAAYFMLLSALGHGQNYFPTTAGGNCSINTSPLTYSYFTVGNNGGVNPFSLTTTVYGSYLIPANTSSGSVTGELANPITSYTGTVTNVVGFQSQPRSSGATVTNAIGFQALSPTNSGTLTNAYGLYINKQNGTGITNPYGIYQADAGDLNYFTGSGIFYNSFTVGVNPSSASYLLSVAGQGGIVRNSFSPFGHAVDGASSYRIAYTNTTTNPTIQANDDYAQNLFGTAYVTTASTGIHNVLANAVFNPLNSITSGGATILSTATVYINGASNVSTPGTINYALDVVSGTSYFGGNVAIAGTTSGAVSIVPQAASGTYNFNLPTTAGTTGQVLTSAGGGTNAMTWTTPTSSGSYLPLAGGSLTGGLTGTTASFSTNVQIGNPSQMSGYSPTNTYALNVNGTIRANQLTVNTTGADFVFEPGYKLIPLSKVEEFIQANHRLPGITPASQMQKEGVDVGDNQTRLLQKVEELTLYLIAADKKNAELGKTVEEQSKLLRQLQVRLEQLEKGNK